MNVIMAKTGSKHTDACRMDDAGLIQQASAGSQTAFMKLFERYKGGLKVHLSKIIPVQEDLEDVVMESFLKAFMQIRKFDPAKAAFRTWLYKIGWNTALDLAGRRRSEQLNMPTTPIDPGLGEGTAVVAIPDPGKDPEEDFSTREEYDKLMLYIDELGDLYRDVARLRLIDDLDYSEIAGKLGLPLNTVRTRIRRAKDELQKMMETSDEIMLPSNEEDD